MSFEAAIGRIDQIIQLQQQVADPAAAAASTSATTSGGAPSMGSASTGTTSTADFASALASATAATGATGATGATATTATAATDPAAPYQLQAMVQQADALVGKPYVWGGGHSGWGPQSGYDCSGFVSAVLHAGGYLSSPQDTTTLPDAPGIEQGPGQYVTIYDRDASGQEGHVIIDLGGQFYESGGGAGAWGGGGGVERIATPSAAYLATFNDVLHPAGM
jgi:cell wall-associated NlpC family hydrolase